MKKKTLGPLLKQQREALNLTQRQLAAKLGVKASHIAYLESDRRRPSLGLLSRIAAVLGLDRETLFLLVHPEARALIGSTRTPAPRRDRHQVWREFTRDKALLSRHNVKARELKILSQVNLLGRVSAPRHFLFILNAIRQAVEED
ncbi:MAG TPA: helix-turn-helix domain-containing protein [Candidatus Binataceae bacterium]|jgi:transcriptional regulator with XRE-family HTH domain|nr:helix-turn-helix domain-containing protein [Candidatus Binataceae bacterium]